MKNIRTSFLKISLFYMLVVLTLIFINSCEENQEVIEFSDLAEKIIFENALIRLEIDNQMHVDVYRKSEDKSLSIIQPGEGPYALIINGEMINNFILDKSRTILAELNNNFGMGKQLKITGSANGPAGSQIEKNIFVDLYENYSSAAIINVEYKNVNSTKGLFIDKEISGRFSLDASLINPTSVKHDFWIFQGGSYNERPDWVLPVTAGFSFENYQGMRMKNDKSEGEKNKEMIELADTQQLSGSEVGGGVPILDVWCKESGLFIGSLREKPTLISLPARVDGDGMLNIAIEYKRNHIEFDDVYNAIPTVIGVHEGDYYNGLKTYSNIMAGKGLVINSPPDDAYKAIWCGWGFGPDFTQDQMLEMIPIIKKFGFKVVTVDAGWFFKNGDFTPRDDTFPNGEQDMKNFVQKFHKEGLKIKLWITTDIAGPELEKEHPEWLIRNEQGSPVGFTFLDGQVTPYLCPALEEVQEYHRNLVKKIIGEWDYDGFKVDQSLINSAPECYDPNHHHQSPEESFAALPLLYKVMYEEMMKLKPDAIFEVCPCGRVPSYYKMPYYNQPVSSDFNTPWQIRHRGKTIKALMGANAAYYGDHVERRFDSTNFPSMIGVGGIPGSMMVSKPEDNVEFLRVKYPGFLTLKRSAYISKWLQIYNEYYLSKGEYINLYDIAFDKPEAHAIKKDGVMYYAFYADEWNGKIEFRGLQSNTKYRIVDYVNDIELGQIKGKASLDIKFDDYLLAKAVPE